LLINKYTSIIFYTIIFCIALFTRSLLGIEIFSFLIGEYIVALALISSLIIIFSYFKRKIDKNLFIAISLIYVNFILIIIINDSNLLSTYTFKSSSYIWMVNYLFLGLIFLKGKFKTNNIYYFLYILLMLIYTTSVIYYPSLLADLFIKYSDKFLYLKASDILAIYVITIFFVSRFKEYDYNDFLIFIGIVSIFIPLFLYMSRGAFFSALIFSLMELIQKRSYFKKSIFKNILLFVFAGCLFMTSSILVQDQEITLSESRSTVSALVDEKNTIDSFSSFYIKGNRLYSTEGNLNWRLQIWQDVFHDLRSKNLLLIGYGYDSIIPAMEDPRRQGLERADSNNIPNENVHSFIVNILARGGIIQILLFINFYFIILKSTKKRNRKDVIQFIIPFLLASSFDVSMEGVQFPLIFFFSLSYILKYLDN
tara:strand:+ start:1212 stop:2483 length:1272 start_codon:yes stop_codon:yes gene_type:complete